MRRVYADHAATTPVHTAVAAAMLRVLEQDWGNPSSVHSYGRAARKHLEAAREQVAGLIGARPAEVFFTSGGTEADNWAIRGTVRAHGRGGKHIITAATEHHAVLDACAQLEREGFAVTRLPVQPDTGLVEREALLAALRPDTALVSIMVANNEIGTVQDIAGLAAAVKERNPDVVFHTDAVQAAGSLPLDVSTLGVDLLTLSAHKLYGPKGVGALWVRRGAGLAPLLYGGGQERSQRPGTENIAGIVGFGQAAELAVQEQAARAAHARSLRDRFLRGVLERIPGVRLNGPDPFQHPGQRHPGNVNLSFPGVEGETLLLRLDMKGIAVSSGSACASGSVEPSHVLLAIGVPRSVAAGSIRVTFGQANSEVDVDYMLQHLPTIVSQLRALAAGQD